MLDGLDLDEMADMICQIRQARGEALARFFPERPAEVDVIVPVLMDQWKTVEPIMLTVIPSLPYVVSVEVLEHIDGPQCHRGWLVTCRG